MNSSCMSLFICVFEMLEVHKGENHFSHIMINMSR
jgi:hypothetical protein